MKVIFVLILFINLCFILPCYLLNYKFDHEKNLAKINLCIATFEEELLNQF